MSVGSNACKSVVRWLGPLKIYSLFCLHTIDIFQRSFVHFMWRNYTEKHRIAELVKKLTKNTTLRHLQKHYCKRYANNNSSNVRSSERIDEPYSICKHTLTLWLHICAVGSCSEDSTIMPTFLDNSFVLIVFMRCFLEYKVGRKTNATLGEQFCPIPCLGWGLLQQ